MKVIKEVTVTGTINHRDAYYKVALCQSSIKDSTLVKVILAVTIRNPVDKLPDFVKVKNILNGRIYKRFVKSDFQVKGRLALYTSEILVSRDILYLFSKETLSAMLN